MAENPRVAALNTIAGILEEFADSCRQGEKRLHEFLRTEGLHLTPGEFDVLNQKAMNIGASTASWEAGITWAIRGAAELHEIELDPSDPSDPIDRLVADFLIKREGVKDGGATGTGEVRAE